MADPRPKPMSPQRIAEHLMDALDGRPQHGVALRLKITPQYFNDILHGRRKLSAEVAVRLEQAMPEVDGWGLYLSQAAWELKTAFSGRDHAVLQQEISDHG